MYHYDAKAALEELKEDAVLPHPVRLRDMIMRTKLDAGHALDLNREFQNYLSHFGETQKIARDILVRVFRRRPRARRPGARKSLWGARRLRCRARGRARLHQQAVPENL